MPAVFLVDCPFRVIDHRSGWGEPFAEGTWGSQWPRNPRELDKISRAKDEEVRMRFPGRAVVAATIGLMAGAALQANSQSYRDEALLTPSQPVLQATDEAALVQAALNRFDSALALRDGAQLEATGVKARDAKRWQSFFRSNPGATVTDSCPAWTLLITGDTARWNCTETATVVDRGKQLSHEQIIHFTFTRRNGDWLIADRR
jgi:hypothetical protein